MYSIIIPCYKSSETIQRVVECTLEEMKNLGKTELEFVLVNDCSPDNRKTWRKLNEIADKYPFVKIIDLAKNVGQHNAVMAGLRHAAGDVIISMDDDMQTNPKELVKMFAAFDEGYDVVYGYYMEKKQTTFRKFGAWFNQMTVHCFLKKPKDIISSSFWIMRKYVRDEIIHYTGAYTYLLGLILRTTNNIKSVEVKHYEREVGSSGYTLKALIKLWSNITGFTSKPLHIIMNLGYFVAGISFISALVVFIRKICNPSIFIGWSSIIISIWFSLGILLISLGLIGEYLGRLYLKVNEQPQYVIREKRNVEGEE